MAQRYDVAIVGLGPVGATLAHLLAMRGVSVLVLERSPDIYPLPRAVHFDDEIMRTFQWIGIAKALLPLLRVNIGMRFIAPDGTLLLDWPRPQEEGPLGWHPSWRFHQPDLERTLRDALARRDGVDVALGADVTEVCDHGDHVSLHHQQDGRTHVAEASYVVGCDGARSLVRHAIGTEQEDLGFHERWLVVDLILKRDMPELGDHSLQFCDPDRPATYVRGPGLRRRWEITLKHAEPSGEATTPEAVWGLLSRWITPQDASIERAAVYTFHSLLAHHWRKGRLLIAGDAAHQTPPFMGQGMCAGIRDAANLGWKLADVVTGRAPDTLLDSYGPERAPNARTFIETAVRLGRLINAADSETALRQALRKPDGGARMKSIYPPLGPGIADGATAGQLFPQPRLTDGRRMDDVAPYQPVLLTTTDLTPVADRYPQLRCLSPNEVPELDTVLQDWGARAVLLRPDRYVWGTASTPDELDSLLSRSIQT